jgi:hypothetical protein
MITDMTLEEALGNKWRPDVHWADQADARMNVLRRAYEQECAKTKQLAVLSSLGEFPDEIIVSHQNKNAGSGTWHTFPYIAGTRYRAVRN